MFARSSNVLVNRVALAAAAVLTPACRDADAPVDVYRTVANGASVTPPPASHADSSAFASVLVVLTSAGTIGYAYSLFSAPSGTIDSIAFYEAAAGDTLPAMATGVLCDGAEACAARGVYVTAVPPATVATIRASLRANGTQVVFFTTTAPKAVGGAMRGTMYPYP
jgi:hypothetical protein